MADSINQAPPHTVIGDRLLVVRSGPTDLVFRLSGNWHLADGLEPSHAATSAIDDEIKRVRFENWGIGAWDSSLVVFVTGVIAWCKGRQIETDLTALPDGIRRLAILAQAVPPAIGTSPVQHNGSWIQYVGKAVINFGGDLTAVLTFVGELSLSGLRLMRGKARYRRRDFSLLVQQTGIEALPIVTIISLLVGLILAFVGALQLRLFGAEAYVANLVGIAVLREMGAIMTGIVLAGRTGAAFAAQIGAMQGNEEIDSLTTLGVPAMDFLVLPRTLALILMTPLLCIYADFMGIIGGLLVSAGMLNITVAGYFTQLLNAITITHVLIGLAKSVVFGIIVAIAGCMKGLNCGRSAADVGNAATEAVVMGILFIIVSDGVFAVMLNYLGL